MDQKGFSLGELNICCCIIAILSAISLPGFNAFQESSHFKQEIRQLYGNLHKGKMEAIKHNSYVVFNLTSNGYLMFVDNGDGGGVSGDWEKQGGERLLINHRYKNEVTMPKTTFSANRGRFSPTSSVKPGRIVLKSESGKQQEVVLSTAGRIRVSRI